MRLTFVTPSEFRKELLRDYEAALAKANAIDELIDKVADITRKIEDSMDDDDELIKDEDTEEQFHSCRECCDDELDDTLEVDGEELNVDSLLKVIGVLNTIYDSLTPEQKEGLKKAIIKAVRRILSMAQGNT